MEIIYISQVRFILLYLYIIKFLDSKIDRNEKTKSEINKSNKKGKNGKNDFPNSSSNGDKENFVSLIDDDENLNVELNLNERK